MGIDAISTALDKVSTILGNIGAPVIVVSVAFGILGLFLHFRK